MKIDFEGKTQMFSDIVRLLIAFYCCSPRNVQVMYVAFSPDGNLLAAGCSSQWSRVHLWIDQWQVGASVNYQVPFSSCMILFFIL